MTDKELKRDVVSRVVSSALHILENSYLPTTKLWPTAGIRMGNGMSVHNKECIFLGVNAQGTGDQLLKGILHMWPTTKNESRERSQKKHVRLILQEAIHDGVYIYTEWPDIKDGHLWFDFKIIT